VVAAPGIEVGLEPQKLKVRKLGGESSVDESDDGRYLVAEKERATAPAHLEVSADGTVVGDLVARVPATCTTGSASAPASAKVVMKRARIAPDGTVVGEAKTKERRRRSSPSPCDLHDKHFSGELTTTYLSCSGTREFEADLAPR
jgi:hypothetical protein